MDTKLKQKLDEFENKRTSLLNEMEDLDETKLKTRPIEEKWSVLEIIEHMVIAEREVLGGLPEYETLESRRQSFKNGIMQRVVLAVLKFKIPVKVPSKRMLPKSELTLAEIREKWDENQKWFRGYVEGLDEEGLKKAVFVHPVSGPLNIEQAVDLSLAHVDRHIGQIRERLELMEV